MRKRLICVGHYAVHADPMMDQVEPCKGGETLRRGPEDGDDGKNLAPRGLGVGMCRIVARIAVRAAGATNLVSSESLVVC